MASKLIFHLADGNQQSISGLDDAKAKSYFDYYANLWNAQSSPTIKGNFNWRFDNGDLFVFPNSSVISINILKET